MKADYFFLLIEDNMIDQLITSRLLKRKLGDKEVIIANNGKEGIEWLLEHRKKTTRPLVVILDIRMPEMDGFEFLSAYESVPEEVKKDTQIIMLSSTLDSNDILRAKNNAYVKDLLSKPLPMQEFEELLSVVNNTNNRNHDRE